ncbi:MAG: hypothetical protein KAV99_02910 [Candidatus Latescibacteria bacterium]|nr:hypothetical protein [Candidatus Latescibacterota bacterium]
MSVQEKIERLKREVDLILTASDDTLIGASLFKEYKVVVDYPQRHVQIERTS